MRAALALLLLLAVACSGRETGPEHFAPKGEHGVFESCAAAGLVDAPAPRRVFDAFMLSAENLMLRLRLEELATVVDKFLLVEGDRTFTGLTRFSEIPVAAPILKPYGKQIVGTLVPLANFSGAWERERFLRDSYRSAAVAAGAAPGDWILGLDLDEVPRRELIALLKRCDYPPALLPNSTCHGTLTLEMDYSYYSLNNRAAALPWRASGTVQVTAGVLAPGFSFNAARADRGGRCGTLHIPGAGWHCSYCFGSMQAITDKIMSFSHTELQRFADLSRVCRAVRAGDDLFRRPFVLLPSAPKWSSPALPPLPHAVRGADAGGQELRALLDTKHYRDGGHCP